MLIIFAAYSCPVQSLTQRRTTEKAPLKMCIRKKGENRKKEKTEINACSLEESDSQQYLVFLKIVLQHFLTFQHTEISLLAHPIMAFLFQMRAKERKKKINCPLLNSFNENILKLKSWKASQWSSSPTAC